jgi:hypothetical protein
MTDEQLLTYIEDHSHTELALVSNAMVKRFMELAREPMTPSLEHAAFISCKYHNIKGLLSRARSYLNLRVIK